MMKINLMSYKNYFFILRFYLIFFAIGLNAQNFYSGSVLDKNGEPIIGASVFVKNSTKGTQTDFDGNFILDANINDVLVVMYIGFELSLIHI